MRRWGRWRARSRSTPRAPPSGTTSGKHWRAAAGWISADWRAASRKRSRRGGKADLPAEREDLLLDSLALGQKPQERPASKSEQPERPRSPDDAVEPLDEHKGRIR